MLKQLLQYNKHCLSKYLGKIPNHFLYQWPHGSNINDLKFLCINGAVQVNMLSYLSQNSQECNISFTSSGGSTK